MNILLIALLFVLSILIIAWVHHGTHYIKMSNNPSIRGGMVDRHYRLMVVCGIGSIADVILIGIVIALGS